MWKLGMSGDRMFFLQWLNMRQLKRISSDLNRFQNPDQFSACVFARPTICPWDWIRPAPLYSCHGDHDTSTDEVRATQGWVADQNVCVCVCCVSTHVHLSLLLTCVCSALIYMCLWTSLAVYEEVELIGIFYISAANINIWFSFISPLLCWYCFYLHYL